MTYSCISEIAKPRQILVHQPGGEVMLAIEHPRDWGFYITPKSSRDAYQWLKETAYEHETFRKAIEGQGIAVVELQDLLRAKQDDCRSYLEDEAQKVLRSLDKLQLDEYMLRITERAIRNAPYMDSPDETVLGGLERDRDFRSLPYTARMHVYKTLQTLMPQASIYYIQDGVITAPNGLVKSGMGMWHRVQEPDILEIALGDENYVHAFNGVMEGGDVTMYEGQMLVGIGAGNERAAHQFNEEFMTKSGASKIIRIYSPDVFNPELAYGVGNLFHLDTYMMPVAPRVMLANISMLERSTVRNPAGKMDSGYDWARKEFDTTIAVPNDEQRGLKWGTNVLPIGNAVITAEHHERTNRNLRRMDINTVEIPLRKLSEGYGSIHCMTAYLSAT